MFRHLSSALKELKTCPDRRHRGKFACVLKAERVRKENHGPVLTWLWVIEAV
jgi:hypothetical protein